MVAHAGFIPLPPDQEVQHLRVTRSFDFYDADYYPFRDLDGSLGAGAAARTVNLPVSQQANPRPGAQAGGFGPDDWYNRIHLIPGTLSLGNLVSSQQRTIEVWNAHFTPQFLASLTPANDAGLTLIEPVQDPTLFGALESRLYTLQISLDGPPTIDASYTFAFPSQTPVLRVTGARVIGFVFKPTWAEGVIERWQWQTDVLTARDGTEQRIALRSIPRREWEYTTTASGADAARADALLWGWGARIYALPIWVDATELTSALSAGALTIPLTTQYLDYVVGALLVLWDPAIGHEIAEVQSVGPSSVTLSRPLEQSWPAGTRVLPAKLARLSEDSVTVRRIGTNINQADLKWRLEPGQAIGGLVGVAATQYLGEDVYVIPSETGAKLDESWERGAEWIDGITGTLAVDDPIQMPKISRRYAWTFNSRQAVSAFKYWLAARQGKQKPAWVPTFFRDFELLQLLGSSATTMIVNDIGYRNFYQQVPGRQDVAILLPNGSCALRRIVGADQVVAGQERIQLSASLGVDLPVGSWISFVGLHRLDSDQIEISWQTPWIAQVSANLRLLKQ